MKPKDKALQVLEYRKNRIDNETLISKARRFMDWLSTRHPYCNEFKTNEMYSDELKSKKETYNYFNPKHNTRTKLPQETCAECDDSENAINVMCYVIQNLIEQKIHFAVFYADGQRSVHIRIYDLDDLIPLEPFERENVQKGFWKDIAGVFFHKLDFGMWQDNHTMQMEFRPHWRYGTPFDLLFEYKPETTTVETSYKTPTMKWVENLNPFDCLKKILEKKKKPIYCKIHREVYDIPTTYKIEDGRIICWACMDDDNKSWEEATVKCKE